MQGLFVFLHWKTLNHRFDICASNKFLSHTSREIMTGISFLFLGLWVKYKWALDKWMEGVFFKKKSEVCQSLWLISSQYVHTSSDIPLSLSRKRLRVASLLIIASHQFPKKNTCYAWRLPGWCERFWSSANCQIKCFAAYNVRHAWGNHLPCRQYIHSKHWNML
jgi:hypothetical protein